MNTWPSKELHNLALGELFSLARTSAILGDHIQAFKIVNTPIPNEEEFRKLLKSLGLGFSVDKIIETMNKDIQWNFDIGPWCDEPVDCGRCILPPWHTEKCTQYFGP